MEPGLGTPHRRVPDAADVDVQWLRRSGRQPVHRHGPEEELLTDALSSNQLVRFVIKPSAFLAALLPAAWIVWAFQTGALSANPLSDVTNETGVWTLRFVCLTLAITPLRRLTGWNVVIRFRRMAGLFAFFYGSLHFLTYIVVDRFASLVDFPDGIVSTTTARSLAAAIAED